jgi:hypothetical protein
LFISFLSLAGNLFLDILIWSIAEKFPCLSSLFKEIREDYELCIQIKSEYQMKVDSISDMFMLRGKNRLKSDNCPAYVLGNFELAPVVIFGINPGYSSKNNPTVEAEARKSWWHYQNYCLNFFQFFARNKFESPYYTALWYLLSGLTGAEIPIQKKWELFDKYLTNVELIPYHSEGIVLPSNLTRDQLKFLKDRYELGIHFISQFNPKIIIFNGKIWDTILIHHKLIENPIKANLTKKFNLYFFELSGIPCVLFDKFFQSHFWGITNNDRMVSIPKLIHSKFKNLSKELALTEI